LIPEVVSGQDYRVDTIYIEREEIPYEGHSGQWTFTGGMFSMYPGGDSNIEEYGVIGTWNDVAPGVTSILYGGVKHEFQGSSTETYGIEGGLLIGFPLRWKWLPMVGCSALGHDKTKDNAGRIQYVSVDVGLAYFPNGFNAKGIRIPIFGIFGIDFAMEIDGIAAFVKYAPGHNRVTAGLGVVLLP